MTEYGQRQRFFQALARSVLAAPQPLVLLVDDLQWCDRETIEWLHYLLRFDPHAWMLVVGLSRDEEIPAQHPLRDLLLHLRGGRIPVSELALDPLDAAETARLAAHLGRRDDDDGPFPFAGDLCFQCHPPVRAFPQIDHSLIMTKRRP
jgi:predicted ATPase